jgi:Type II site-specific deoxyribonuclease
MPSRSTHDVFPPDFIVTLRGLVGLHQSLYPTTPPQGIYFESLVEQAFRRIKKPFDMIQAGGRNQPRHDLLVDDQRISLKTETGLSTDPRQITITKLCTTEREPWEARVLVERVMEHLARYDIILMFRSVWSEGAVHYQLVDIPVLTLRMMEKIVVEPVGRRKGRQSLAADIMRGEQRIFRVHFDASDGKCSVRNLGIEHCVVLEEWDVRV